MLLLLNLESFILLLERLAADPWLLFLVLMAATLISEDIAIVGAALMVAEGLAGLSWAFSAIIGGIVIGDTALYGLGWLAARYRKARALVASRKVYQMKRFVRGRLGLILLSTRFLPGSRIPTYTACGFFGFSLSYFFIVLSLAALVWTGIVFAVVITTGTMVLDSLGPWKWVGAAGFIILIFLFPRLVGQRLARRMGLIAPAAKAKKAQA